MEKLRSGESVENNKNNKKRIIIVLAILLLVFLIIMLFCLFSSKTYEITFDSDGGTEIEPIKVKENEKVNKPINPLKEGYSFDGWYYLNELYDFNTPVKEDMTLKAKWEELTKLDELSFSTTEVTLSPDGTALLTPIIQPEDVTDIKLIWSSSDESIVTVDENGNIKAIKEGTAIITVMTSDGIHTASCKVIVSKEVIKAESIKISGLNVVTVGGTINLTAKVSPDNATNKSVNWTSSNNRVATVDSSGYVRGISAGKVTITATTIDGGHKATYEITVNAETTKTNTSASNNSANNSSSSKSQKPATVHVTSVNISGTNRVLVGQSINLSANVSPGNATNKGISWSSNNPSVARVEQNGRVTGVNDGTATITVTTSDGNHQASITVTVSSTYSITFTADRTSADGEITGYYAHVYKNGSLFTGYDYLLYNGMEKPFKQRILKSEVNTGVRSAKVNVNGTYYDATVSYN